MTAFQSFQGTRQACADLGLALGDESLQGQPGFLYGTDAMLCIQTRCAAWSGTPADDSAYLLIIGNQEWLSDDLADLEARLYHFAVSEGLAA